MSYGRGFCLSVRICTVVTGAISGRLLLRFWVTVDFLARTLLIDRISEGKVVLYLWPNNFSADEFPCLSGCIRDDMTRK